MKKYRFKEKCCVYNSAIFREIKTIKEKGDKFVIDVVEKDMIIIYWGKTIYRQPKNMGAITFEQFKYFVEPTGE